MSTELQKHEPGTLAQTQPTWRRPYYIITEEKDRYLVSVFMPGVSKGDYNVSLQKNELSVEGRKGLNLPEGARWLHREISPEGYRLRLHLNVDVDAENIAAKTEEGVLRITLPVAQEARPRTIRIQ